MARDMGEPFPEATGELANVAGVFRHDAELARDRARRAAASRVSTRDGGRFPAVRPADVARDALRVGPRGEDDCAGRAAAATPLGRGRRADPRCMGGRS